MALEAQRIRVSVARVAKKTLLRRLLELLASIRYIIVGLVVFALYMILPHKPITVKVAGTLGLVSLPSYYPLAVYILTHAVIGLVYLSKTTKTYTCSKLSHMLVWNIHELLIIAIFTLAAYISNSPREVDIFTPSLYGLADYLLVLSIAYVSIYIIERLYFLGRVLLSLEEPGRFLVFKQVIFILLSLIWASLAASEATAILVSLPLIGLLGLALGLMSGVVISLPSRDRIPLATVLFVILNVNLLLSALQLFS